MWVSGPAGLVSWWYAKASVVMIHESCHYRPTVPLRMTPHHYAQGQVLTRVPVSCHVVEPKHQAPRLWLTRTCKVCVHYYEA